MEMNDPMEESVANLIGQLRDSRSKEDKKWFFNILAEHDAEEFRSSDLDAIADYLSDSAPGVRSRAASLLGRCRSRSHLEALLPLTEDKNEDVACAAAIALGEIGDPTAIDSLLLLEERFHRLVEKAQLKGTRQQIIRPTIYPGDMGSTISAFQLRQRMGHDKAERRSQTAVGEAWHRLQAVRDALSKLGHSAETEGEEG